MSVHGTHVKYTSEGCRCVACTKAEADRYKGHKENTRAHFVDVRAWADGLGFQLSGRARKPLIERYNREHPERPFVSEANDKAGRGAWDV